MIAPVESVSVFQEPIITSVTPNFAPLSGGTVITMNGTDLNVGKTINFVKIGQSTSCSSPHYVNSR